MREIRPSGSEGGVAPRRHPYPYLQRTAAMTWRPRGIRLRSASYAGTRRGPCLLGVVVIYLRLVGLGRNLPGKGPSGAAAPDGRRC
jgi:hypothetical protein